MSSLNFLRYEMEKEMLLKVENMPSFHSRALSFEYASLRFFEGPSLSKGAGEALTELMCLAMSMKWLASSLNLAIWLYVLAWSDQDIEQTYRRPFKSSVVSLFYP